MIQPYSSSDRLRSDRSAADRARHRQKVRKAIKEQIADIIAEESIIGKDRGKTIKVPIRGIKEYRFVYGINNPGVGQGTGEEQPGDSVEQQDGENEGADRAGDQPGEDYYETEVTLEEVIQMLFEDLELPDMERKRLSEITAERIAKPKGMRRVGIRVRLKKPETVRQLIRRQVASGFTRFRKKMPERITEEQFQEFLGQYTDDEAMIRKLLQWYYPDTSSPGWRILRNPISQDDMRFKHFEPKPRKESNAVVFCIMDTSGSMDTAKKYIARGFFFLLYEFVRLKYRNVEVVFVAHHTEGKEVTEEEFFHKGESGGTFISSGYLKALEIIHDRYHPDLWNIYAFHCSDGDNFESDNKQSLEAAKELCDVCRLFGYGEIKPKESRTWESSMIKVFKEGLKGRENFSLVYLRKKEDLLEALRSFLAKEKNPEEAV